MYLINQVTKYNYSVVIVRRIMVGYFNDFIGSITFLAYCSIILNFYNDNIKMNIWQAELLTMLCGIFWEYITPMFRKNTVSDVYDIFAYMFGGIVYCILRKVIMSKISC